MKRLLVIAIVVLTAAGGRRAYAYPQFELSKDQSCAGCHISPTGGGLLSENGLAVADTISQFGTAPEFMYGKVKTPDWLAVGGDFRGNWGYLQAPQRYLIGFPMQADLYGAATKGAFSAYLTLGYRPPEEGNEAATSIWAREAYVAWNSDPSARQGVFVRVGRFMPVFGLRLAEHPAYTRRYGGTPLYSETWGAMVSYVNDKVEAYATGFIKDPLIDPVRLSNGGAAYAELRVTPSTIVGAGGMAEISDFDQHYRGAVVAKQYLDSANLLFQGELQFVNPHVGDYGYKQIVGYAMATWYGPAGTMIDLGYGHFDENLRIHALDRDCIDVNIHWFATSHFEAVLNNRVELMAGGGGGPTGAYSLLMAHYRL